MIFIYILLCAAVITAILYVFLIGIYCYGWIKTKQPVLLPLMVYTKVNVVVAARNEEKNIKACIHALLSQSYPKSFLRITIVDDFSEDATNNILVELASKHEQIEVIELASKNWGTGKKIALKAAIDHSTAELIVTTDADCTMGKHWISTLVAYYQQTNVKMIVAPVMINRTKRFFENLQAIELMALVTSGAASLFFNKATLCNGANLAYARNVFYEVNGFEGINNSPSGDDVLLMYKIKNRYKAEISFLKHKNAIVYTQPVKTINDFFSQRKRWATKRFSLLNIETKITSMTVFTFNTMLFLLFLVGLFYGGGDFMVNVSFWKIFYLLLGVKCIFDFLLLFLATSFWGKKRLLRYFLFQEIFYIVYIVTVGFIAFKRGYYWKGRKYS